MINRKEVLDKVEDYLLTYIGNLVGPGTPYFDSKRNVWVIPIFHMSNVATFPLDEIHMDIDGNLVHVPTRERLIEIAEKRFEKNKEIKEVVERLKHEVTLST